MYGKSADIDMNAQSGKDMIIEFSELVNNAEKPVNRPTTVEMATSINNVDVGSNQPKSAAPGPAPTKLAIHKQIETRTVDGKRRITPMFIPLNQDQEMT